MNKGVATYITLLLFAVPTTIAAQDTASVSTPDSLMQGRSDSVRTAASDSLQNQIPENEEKQIERVVPWQERIDIGYQVFSTDSLLRWQIWPNWGDFYAYRRDVLSFRQGSSGRVDAFHINGYHPEEQQLELEGLGLNNPITGLPNYSLVPHHKIGRADEFYGNDYYSRIKLRDYYLTKPLSYLNYDEAGGNYRNLEFMVTRNFSAKTNLELSYWDRRAGGYYPSSEVEGSQIAGRLYHHLDDRWLLRTMYLRNQVRRDEPFGYLINNPETFPFSQFRSTPVVNNGATDFTRWDFITGIYHRKDTLSKENAGLEISITKNKNELTFSADTLGWNLTSPQIRAFHTRQFGRFSVKGDAASQFHFATQGSSLSKTKWNETKASISAGFDWSESLRLFAVGNSKFRSDGFTDYGINGGLSAQLGNMIKLKGSIGTYGRMPTMQALYWSSAGYHGNENLKNETGISANGSASFRLFKRLEVGASGRYKKGTKATYLTTDSTFTNSAGFEQLAGTVYGMFENHRFEFESSATVQQFYYDAEEAGVAVLNHQDQVAWMRNSAFIKGYVFDRAAYLKLGLKSLFSPFYYRSRTFNEELNIWQGSSLSYTAIPPFFRLDAELSARVRAIMVVIRWENTLDGFGQAGYFESAGYPMPPRRLIVGIRAQFRN